MSDTDAHLVQLLAEVRALRSEVAALCDERRQQSALAPSDQQKLAELFPLAYSAVGDRAFSVRSLNEYDDARLRHALTTCGSPHARGKLLRRALAHDVAGFRLRLVGNDGANIF